MTRTVQLRYTPRAPFLPYHQRTQRWSLMACHRRSGKTVACVNDLALRGVHTTRAHARYGYVAPFRQQAKEIAWTYLKQATQDIIVSPPRESELRVILPNDVWITLYGADNPDALRGLYFDGLVLDEFGDMKPSLLGEVILPCLADRKGWLSVIGTAKGRNQFYDYKKKAQSDPRWFYRLLKASESGIIPESELQNLRDVMTPEQYEQEMECSFDAALQGTYYADVINKIKLAGRIIEGDRLYEPSRKVHVAADVGLRDSTAWWFWQPREEGPAIIDYYEASGKHVEHYLEMLHNKGYQYHEIWFPHDAKAKTLATRRSTVEQFANPHETVKDIPHLAKAYPDGTRLPIRIVPKLSKQHGIDAVRMALPRCYIDGDRCEAGLDALRSYQRSWNETARCFSNEPYHNWASNGADGFRYFALVEGRSQGMLAEGELGTPEVEPNPWQAQAWGNQGVPSGLTLDTLYAEQKQRHRGRPGILRVR